MEEVITEVNPDFIIVIVAVADYPNNDGYLPVIGGTVIPLSAETAKLGQPYIYLCKDADGDYFAKYNDPAIVTKGYNKKDKTDTGGKI